MNATPKPAPVRLTVIGGGSWATAIIKILSEGDVRIKWWLRNQADIDFIRQHHRNPHYLSDVPLNPRKVKACANLAEALEDAAYVVLAVPAAFVAEPLRPLSAGHFTGKTVVSAIKGMIPGANLLVTDWLEATYGVSPQNLCVIGGPCHAEEVALEKQSYLTIASDSLPQATDFARLMTCRYVQASPLHDVYGVEYCAVMKNIIALACGITHGLGYGDNFQAVLVANAMQEMQRFLDVVYPHYRDLSGSAYLGDLLVTAYSQFSRNRTFGSMIGRGYSVQSAQLEMNMVAEGYYAVKSIQEINQTYRVEMPITETVYHILYGKKPAAAAVNALRTRLK